MTKRCANCREVKPHSEFYRNKNEPDGRWIYCKLCDDERRKRVLQNNPSLIAEKHLRQRFGLTLQKRDALIEQQNHKCKVCGQLVTGRWQIDHDHNCCPGRKSCGKCIRGLLCISCNKGLGDFQDNPAILLNAVSYLSIGMVS